MSKVLNDVKQNMLNNVKHNTKLDGSWFISAKKELK